MPALRPVLLGFALFGAVATAACNGETPTTKVGSGSGETNNAGAQSGRVPGADQPAPTTTPRQ